MHRTKIEYTEKIYALNAADILIYGFIGLLGLVTIYPFILVVSMSLSDPSQLMAGKVYFFPAGFSLISYQKVIENTYLWRSLGNSVFYTIIITAISSINSICVGFALNRKGLVFRKYIILLLLIPMFFSGGLIPTFIIVQRMGLYNNVLAIILPALVSIYNCILCRSYIHGIPDGLQEAAYIDGASDFKVLSSIIIPLSKPILAVIALYTAVAVWNSWFNAMVYLPRLTNWHPLQLYLTRVLIWGQMQAKMDPIAGSGADAERLRILNMAVGAQLKYTIIVISSLPIIMVYPFIQKYFIKGALLGSLKE